MQLVAPPGKVIDGEIIFNGRDLLKLGENRMQHVRGNEIGMIFQAVSYTHLDVYKRQGHDRIYTAGEKEYETWLYRKDKGVPVNEELLKELIIICLLYTSRCV